MSTLTYTTVDGDVLDDICFRYYGKAQDASKGVKLVEFVLLANPGLADLGPVYHSGVKIKLPDLPAAQKTTPVNRPWGTF